MAPARSRRAAWRGLNCVGGRVAGKSTSAAFFTRWRLTSNSDTDRNARRPARKPSALGFHPIPKAVTMPAPVMTTREGAAAGGEMGKSMGPESADE
jgi:hypothetical protein